MPAHPYSPPFISHHPGQPLRSCAPTGDLRALQPLSCSKLSRTSPRSPTLPVPLSLPAVRCLCLARNRPDAQASPSHLRCCCTSSTPRPPKASAAAAFAPCDSSSLQAPVASSGGCSRFSTEETAFCPSEKVRPRLQNIQSCRNRLSRPTSFKFGDQRGIVKIEMKIRRAKIERLNCRYGTILPRSQQGSSTLTCRRSSGPPCLAQSSHGGTGGPSTQQLGTNSRMPEPRSLPDAAANE